METNTHSPVLILGSGPAGLTAAIYAARANLSPIVLAGAQPGGQLMLTSGVENYPGFHEGILGPDLMNNMMEQAKRFGTNITYDRATNVDFSKRPFTVQSGNKTYTGDSIIVATGASARWLEIDSEQRLIGKGVSSCATCDGAFFKDKEVAVVGGGDSAMEEALFLTRFASKVTIIHRRDEFRSSHIMLERAQKNDNIDFLVNSEVVDVIGDDKVTGIKIRNNVEESESEMNIDGLFIAIGHIPNTDFLKNHLELDKKGYIVTRDEIHTSIEGIFVAGDVEDAVYRQAVTAAGMGCKAALEAERWLGENES